jgi:hypothetical protein
VRATRQRTGESMPHEPGLCSFSRHLTGWVATRIISTAPGMSTCRSRNPPPRTGEARRRSCRPTTSDAHRA